MTMTAKQAITAKSAGTSLGVSGLAPVATSGAMADVTGSLSLAQMAPGATFFINWSGSAWQYHGTTITTRPSSRTDLVMVAVGGTTVPSFALTNDVWLQDTS